MKTRKIKINDTPFDYSTSYNNSLNNFNKNSVLNFIQNKTLGLNLKSPNTNDLSLLEQSKSGINDPNANRVSNTFGTLGTSDVSPYQKSLLTNAATAGGNNANKSAGALSNGNTWLTAGLTAMPLLLNAFDRSSQKVGNKYAEMLINDKPEVRDATYLTYKPLAYNDRSQAMRNQLTNQNSQMSSIAKNVSGGNVNMLLNMMSNYKGNLINQLGQINTQEAMRYDDIQAKNTMIYNQMQDMNTRYYDENKTFNEMNRARSRDMNRLGYKTLYDIAEMNRMNRRQALKDSLAYFGQGMENAAKQKQQDDMYKKLFGM
jgi:hypothetical protein